MNKVLLSAILLLITLFPSYSQTIRGKVIDANHQPMAYAAVTFRLLPDSAFENGVTTDDKGIFTYKGSARKHYLLTISCLGYEEQQIDLTTDRAIADAGIIQLKEGSVKIDEVTVAASRVIAKSDRLIVLPGSKDIRSSSNGYDLLRNLSLKGLQVSSVENKISSIHGGGVQVRINDVIADTHDILALRPDEVIRVEYIENPGVRYSDAGLDAVINYVVRRRSTGYVGGIDGTQAVATGFGNYFSYFKYNRQRSEFGLNYGVTYRGYNDDYQDQQSRYIYPDGTERHINYRGFGKWFSYQTHDLQATYNLCEPDRYNLNIKFSEAYYDNPHRGYKQQVEESGQKDLFIESSPSALSNTPSLDVYYSIHLPHKQSITANVVGTYIGTDSKYNMQQYIYKGTPKQSVADDPIETYAYSTDGKKYSLISEAIYTKSFPKTALSAGMKYTVSRTDNQYSGSVNTDARLNTHNYYGFVQLQGTLRPLHYQIGIGANRQSIHQDETGFTKWTFRPSIVLSANVAKNVSVKYSGSIVPTVPSLRDLSDVRQQTNSFEVSAGNPELKPYRTYRNRMDIDWNIPLLSFNVEGSYNHDADIIMNTILPEQQSDGSYLFVFKPENQKYLATTQVSSYVQIHAIKEVLDLMFYGYYQHYKSRGGSYSHNYDSWLFQTSINLTLGNWNIYGDYGTQPKYLFGETIGGGERASDISVSYKRKGWQFGAGCLLVGIPEGYDYTSETNSRYFQSMSHRYFKDNGNMLYLRIAFNFSHGRKYRGAEKTLNNSDNASGVK